jgi:hypothetical protein
MIISAIPIPFLDDFLLIICSLWFLLFFASFLIPMITGVMLLTLEPELRPKGTSIATTC